MSEPVEKQRYTVDGGSALEARVDTILAETRAATLNVIPEGMVEGLALCGGYGRGEGGVFVEDDGSESLYNDLEFFLFLKGSPAVNSGRYAAKIHQEAERLTERHGIEVELKISSIDTLRRSVPNMFYYDLVMGHRWVIGDATLFDGMDQHRDGGAIPLSEATRLLMNRLSGLVFTRARLENSEWTEADSDFAQRNIAKTELALGDAVLTAQGQYHWSCVERGRRLEALLKASGDGLFSGLATCHERGRGFKLRPVLEKGLDREAMRRRLERLAPTAQQVWLWVESRRLGASFASATDYLNYRGSKTPGTLWLKNLLLNAKFFGVSAALGSRGCRYPRERLFEALTAALWTEGKQRERVIMSALRTPAVGRFKDWIGEYERLWGRFG